MIEGPQFPYYLVPLLPFLSFFTIYHLCPVNSDSSINHKTCRYSPQKIRFWYSLSSQARGRKKGTIPEHQWWLKSETAACGRTAKLRGKITALTFQRPVTAPTPPQLGRSPGFQALPDNASEWSLELLFVSLKSFSLSIKFCMWLSKLDDVKKLYFVHFRIA